MAGFRSVKKYAQAWEDGRVFTSHFRKAPSAATASGWSDFSVHPGGPPAQYYANTPLAAAVLNGSRGFYHGDDKSPAQKYLTKVSVTGTAAANSGPYMFLDYVLFYPFVDSDDLTEQVMDNTVTLPRYEDGEGLMVMAVAQSTTSSLNGVFTMSYVNSRGETKTSPAMTLALGTVQTGGIISGAGATFRGGPFIPLASGDSGIRQINSVTFTSANGGLLALVIVKPLATLTVREASTTAELDMVTMLTPLPRVYDGAFISYIQYNTSSQASTFVSGRLEFIWDEGT